MFRHAGDHEPRRWPWQRRDASAGPACRPKRNDAEVLVCECEAFVVGRYAEELEARGQTVPVWAWTNLLAHGSGEDIGRAAAPGHRTRSSSPQWRRARAMVARDVLDALDHGTSLAELQREVLAPLELRLAGHRGAWGWTGQRWLDTVRSALRNYRPSTRA